MGSESGKGGDRDQSGPRRATTSYWAKRPLQLVGQAEELSSANHILIPVIMDPVNHLFSPNPYHDYRMSFPSSPLLP